MSRIFQDYLREVKRIYSTNDYTEHTFRTCFENFIDALGGDFNLQQEPSRVRGLGAPDFKAFRGSVKVGYIETKSLGENLDEILETEQLRRYIGGVDNLVLTNYARFILLKRNEIVFDFNLFNLSDLGSSGFSISEEKISTFTDFLESFFGYSLPTISSAKELAVELSRRAKLLKVLAKKQLDEDLSGNGGHSSVFDFYEGLKELIKDIDVDDCADAYAQTITYGLFLAKLTQNKRSPRAEFSIQTASSFIPRNVGVIRRIFINISSDVSQSNSFSWIVEDMIDILNATNVDGILPRQDRRGRKDPLLFFYEDFLESYDPEKRKHFGEYYTPRPVVNFIVNVVHQILKKDFDRFHGLAEDDVTVLDPAVGTGTFLWIAFLAAFKELKNSGRGGLVRDKIENHILKDFYGFEISIVSYIISHIKLTDLLAAWNYSVGDDERIQVYLTNTLEPRETHGLLPFMSELSDESRRAEQIKKKPILAIIGNPPYHGMSSNKGKWIVDLLKRGYERADGSVDDGYYMVDGEPLGERNPKWLQDDYVKFIRFSQWKIDKAGEGVLGFITNHSYLDNPTFRGMRESLSKSFDRIYILNLHGNVKKKERCPDGGRDENVFDIQQGVAVTFFVKSDKYSDKKVFYADLWGDRNHKYEFLDEIGFRLSEEWLNVIEWRELEIRSPNYYFIPVDYSLEDEYMKYWEITDIFPVNSVGVVTSRDNFVIDFDRQELENHIKVLRGEQLSDEELRQRFKLRDKKNWKLRNVREAMRDKENWRDAIAKVLYRPFDTRWMFYDDLLIERSRKEVMQHMLKENLGLITVRQVAEGVFNHAYITQDVVESRITLSNKGIAYIFPLYLYSDSEREPNINTEFLGGLSSVYGSEPLPEEVFYYIYAVLYSNNYRERYAEFLSRGFSHIPFTEDYGKFRELSELGEKLSNLHLEKTILETHTRFDIEGSNKVEKVSYEEGKVFINKEQYFGGVPREAWEYYIGGYKVLDKWLKSRKKRKLTGSEIEHYLQIIEIIKETIKIMHEIDETQII
ncbi:MAG: type ISP restriction/modification enzyme [Candidatus Altiarchaeota archaeon]|nr:type ISP restriction/modification enzyme [Candidatus Altiarchaeota archaeon]